MVTVLKFAVVSAIFLLPFAPLTALFRGFGLSVIRRPSGCVAPATTRLATSCTGTRWLALRCRTQPVQSNNRTDYPAHPTAPTGTLGSSRSSTPILFRLAFHRLARRVFHLEPTIASESFRGAERRRQRKAPGRLSGRLRGLASPVRVVEWRGTPPSELPAPAGNEKPRRSGAKFGILL
jgi:hypothetical protein